MNYTYRYTEEDDLYQSGYYKIEPTQIKRAKRYHIVSLLLFGIMLIITSVDLFTNRFDLLKTLSLIPLVLNLLTSTLLLKVLNQAVNKLEEPFTYEDQVEVSFHVSNKGIKESVDGIEKMYHWKKIKKVKLDSYGVIIVTKKDTLIIPFKCFLTEKEINQFIDSIKMKTKIAIKNES